MNTPTETALSAMLNTGRKKTSDCPGFIGDHSGHVVSITGK